MRVYPKKRLGQHFLRDNNTAFRIVEAFCSLLPLHQISLVIEVGPGTGALTGHLLKNIKYPFCAVEVDEEAASFLAASFPLLKEHLIREDFLKISLAGLSRAWV